MAPGTVFEDLPKENKKMIANDLQETICAWQTYLSAVPTWQQLIIGQAKECGCGLVYSIPNPIDRANESFAIADMSNLAFSEPHYHPEIEIYFILQGSGLVVVGKEEHEVKKGSIVIIPSNIAHFTIPEKDLVMAVVNTPPFNEEHYYPLAEDNNEIIFNKNHFDRLCKDALNK